MAGVLVACVFFVVPVAVVVLFVLYGFLVKRVGDIAKSLNAANSQLLAVNAKERLRSMGIADDSVLDGVFSGASDAGRVQQA